MEQWIIEPITWMDGVGLVDSWIAGQRVGQLDSCKKDIWIVGKKAK